jgi:hypothetical protein
MNVQDAPAGPTSLEQQGHTQQVSGMETERLQPANSKLKRWLPGLVLLLIAILLPTFYVLRQWNQTRVIPPTPPATAAPPAIPQPPQPPPPPAPPAQGTGTKIDQSYIYPGARTTMVISKAGEGDMLQLSSDDSLDKVADWYVEKFKPTKIVRQPDSAVLKSEKMVVILTANGKGTNIMLKQGAD